MVFEDDLPADQHREISHVGEAETRIQVEDVFQLELKGNSSEGLRQLFGQPTTDVQVSVVSHFPLTQHGYLPDVRNNSSSKERFGHAFKNSVTCETTREISWEVMV